MTRVITSDGMSKTVVFRFVPFGILEQDIVPEVNQFNPVCFSFEEEKIGPETLADVQDDSASGKA